MAWKSSLYLTDTRWNSMLGITEQSIEQVYAQKWPQSASILMLEHAERLFACDNPLHIKNSKQQGVFREHAIEEHVYLLKTLMLNLDRQNYVDGHYNRTAHDHALKLLETTPIQVIKDENALNVTWGRLIKDCMNNGEIIDLNDPAIKACHEKLLNNLKEAYAINPVIPGEVNACFQSFLIDLRKTHVESALKAAFIIDKFIHFASLVANNWDNERAQDESTQMKHVSMLLGPCLFKALQLNGKLFDANMANSLLESYVYKVGLLDILLSLHPVFAKDVSIINNFRKQEEASRRLHQRKPSENRPPLKKSQKFLNLRN